MERGTKKTGKKIIVGLGNSGPEYENTYHNAGALALNTLIARQHDPASTASARDATLKKYKNFFTYLETPDAVFIRPLTYMNESGTAVREAVKKFAPAVRKNLDPASLIILHDDSDLTIGTYKISVARGAAGHNGAQSIIDALRTKNFTRIRIGIRPAHERVRQKAGDFALKPITASDRTALKKVFSEIAAQLASET